MTDFRTKRQGQPSEMIKDKNGIAQRPLDKQAAVPFDLEKFLFHKQYQFVTDPHPFKIAVCSRRAGKTVSCAAHLIHTAINTPEINCLYITLTRSNAKKIIWRDLLKINKDYNLKAIPDQVELSLTFPNGSIIYLSGAKDESEIEKFRGMSFKLVYIDECQSFRPHIEQLIDDVLAPALMDYDGSLCLIGTPGALPVGYFAEVAGVVQDKAAKAAAWVLHSWTFFDNPHIAMKSKKTHQQMLDRELRRRGVTVDDPTIQREWFGKWTLDSETLWVKYSAERNHYQELPPPPPRPTCILGIDLGFNDADALAVLAYYPNSHITYLAEEVITSKQGITELVEQIKKLQAKYEIVKMVIDEGGLGKKIAEELRRRHSIPVVAADKARKQENIAFLNDALRTQAFKAKSASRFAQDSYLVEIDRSKSRPDKIVISDRYHSDIIDAVLYAFRESPSYAYEAPQEKAKPGTPEWYKEEEERMIEQDMEAIRQQYEQEQMLENPYGFDSG